MDDEKQELRGRIARSERARAIIEDPLLVEAFDTLRQRFINDLLRSSPDQAQLREHTYHHILALDEVRLKLALVLEDGSLARVALADLAEPNPNP